MIHISFPKVLTMLCLLTALFAGGAARAVDGFSLEAGCCVDNTNLGRIGMLWDWESRWYEADDWFLGGYWDLSMGYWSGDENSSHGIKEIGLIPTFHLRQKGSGAVGYVEAAVGLYFVDGTRIHNKNLSTNFQFGDHVGAGILFGDKQQYDLGIRLQHLSNGGVENPNPGINFLILRFAYRY